MYVNIDEHKWISNFIERYRSVASSCDKPNCFVFQSSQVPENACCSPLDVSSIGKRISRSFNLAGINKNIGTRIVRRVLETFMREEMKDPGWNMHLAMAANHSLTTADKYYDYTNRNSNQKLVVNEIKLRRKEAIDKKIRDDRINDWINR